MMVRVNTVHFHTALGYIVLSIIITINSNGLGSLLAKIFNFGKHVRLTVCLSVCPD